MENNIMYLLQKGCECLNFRHNMQKACEYFAEARESIERIYGKNSRLCCLVNMFDFVWEEYHRDYRTAVLKLADVGELLEAFREQEIVDEFTGFIFENKEEILNGLAADTLKILMRFDFDFAPGDILWQAILLRGDKEELINRTLIDKLGLPRRFHYLSQHIWKDNLEFSSEAKIDVIEMLNFMEEMKNGDLSTYSQKERIDSAKKMYDFMEKGSNMLNADLGSGMSIFMREQKVNMENILIRGMVNLGETDFADGLLERLKEKDFQDIDSQLEIMRMECSLEHRKGNNIKAGKILDEMIQMIENVLIQIFAFKSEQKRIEFLYGMELIIKQTVGLCYEVQGAKAAYNLVLRTRTLSFECKGIMANSLLYTKFLQDVWELDEREKRGEDVSFERAKCQKYFENESDGIFSLDSAQICRKLKEGQAVLEFTVIKDISDYEFYYVFVVTVHGVSIIKLGECGEIDSNIEEVLRYISEYEVSKHSECQIKMLPGYYEIYRKVLQPIGEDLPRSVQKLFIVGAGEFLQVPFGMLPCFHWYDEFMEDEYQISYLNSGKELLRDAKAARDCDAVVVGNPDFAGEYTALPSSLREVEAVAEILNVKPFVGTEAVKECLEKQAGIFHISTHSFTGNEKNVDPMEQACLVFSGGQKLTAREISQIDMTKTELIVLSACGVKEEKGIYSEVGAGLRRAFINAGARCLILNLWKTDDNAAEILMKCFYYHYIKIGMSIEESIQKAKNYLRTSTIESIRRESYYDKGMEKVFACMPESEIPYAHPYYWAGFIVIGT